MLAWTHTLLHANVKTSVDDSVGKVEGGSSFNEIRRSTIVRMCVSLTVIEQYFPANLYQGQVS